MLRLNISIVLSFIRIGLNFMNSSADDNMDLIENYKQRVIFNDLYAVYSPYLKYDRVCNMPKEDRVAFCRTVIRQLRSQNKLNIYMNYLAFIEREPCTDVRVWINERDVLVHQTALNCFGRSAILALESQEEMVYFHRRIVIYPDNASYMWVFEYNEVGDYYIILTLIQLKWSLKLKSTAVFNKLFSIPTPQSWWNISDLFTILYPVHQQLIHYSDPTKSPSNIVHLSKNYDRCKICYLVSRSENYNKKLNHETRHRRKPKPIELKATLRGPSNDLSVSIIAYTCNDSIDDPTFMNQYSIAAGPGDYSVILLKNVNSDNDENPRYVIIELVEYVTEDYISAYVEKFY